jgi:hypothetical protein
MSRVLSIQGWLLALFLIGGATLAAQEAAPAGLRFLHQRESLDRLRARTQPQLIWREGQEDHFFLWFERDAEGPVFTLDRAYHLSSSGRQIWTFLDAESARELDFQHPIREFLAQKFVREKIRPDAPHPDGNHSYAQMLSQREDGAAVYNVVYSSLSGAGAHQEAIQSFLIYVSPNGECKLGAKGLDRQGGSKSGWIGHYRFLEMEVEWTAEGAAPFQVKLRKGERMTEAGEGATLPVLTIYEEGSLTGSFPLEKRMSGLRYLKADGEQTLNSLAALLIAYYSDWVMSDWVSGQQRNAVKLQWQGELERLNPQSPPDRTIPAGQRIAVPQGAAFNRVVYDAIAEGSAAEVQSGL